LRPQGRRIEEVLRLPSTLHIRRISCPLVPRSLCATTSFWSKS